MAYDELLAERIQRVYQEKKVPFSAKKMFGGVCLLIVVVQAAIGQSAGWVTRLRSCTGERQKQYPGRATSMAGTLLSRGMPVPVPAWPISGLRCKSFRPMLG